MRVGDVCDGAYAGIEGRKYVLYGTGRMGEAVGATGHLGRRRPCGRYLLLLSFRPHIRLLSSSAEARGVGPPLSFVPYSPLSSFSQSKEWKFDGRSAVVRPLRCRRTHLRRMCPARPAAFEPPRARRVFVCFSHCPVFVMMLPRIGVITLDRPLIGFAEGCDGSRKDF
jgi:hypothetical protein